MKEKKYYVPIKDFNTFMYDHTLHRGRKHFYCFCLQAFRPEEILKVILKTALKLIVNKLIKCLRSGNILNSEPMEEK